MNITTSKIFGIALIAAVFTGIACKRDVTTPGLEYMPNMYRGPQSNTYSANGLFSDSASARMPVEGTVPRGYTSYNIPNTTQGYFSALEMPGYPSFAPGGTEANMLEGERLYTRFCVNCHGVKGDGNGNLMEQGKFAGVPSYDSQRLPKLTPQSIFHVITYGKGVMGSHAAQIESKDRWKIARHVLKLRAELDGTAAPGSEKETESIEE
jgi:mono/diheme cytochrome c family protein